MVRPLQTQATDHQHSNTSIPLAICLFVSASAVATLCAKHARQVSRNYYADAADTKTNDHNRSLSENHCVMQEKYDQKMVPKSPLRSPKKFIATISNKAITPFLTHHKKSGGDCDDDDVLSKGGNVLEDEGFGEGGLWQKDILMGEKCQPPEFSGVIYYDCDGKQISELPPRANYVPTFSFPAVIAEDDDN